MSECAPRRLSGVVGAGRVAKDLFTSSTGLDYKAPFKLREYDVSPHNQRTWEEPSSPAL